MWTPQYDIIVETLTGSEFEVTVTDKDTIGYIKSRIQKYEGIPVIQQHLLYNQKELSDTTEMKDIPLVKGSRLKLVLGMKGGPVSARRVVTLPDYDSWFDLNDILNTSRQDPLTISTSGVKLLVYKDCKKNIHRVMKFRADRKNSFGSRPTEIELPGEDHQDDQWLKDNIHTMEKMHQLRTKLDSKKKKKNLNIYRNQVNEETVKKIGVGAIGDKSNKKDNDQESKSILSDGYCKTLRRLYFPPLKTPSLPLSNNLNNSNVRNDLAGYSDHGYRGGSVLNKHGIAKTCIRPPSITTAQQQERKSPTPPPSTQKLFDFNDYFNINNKLGLGYNYCTENRSKIRDNIRRNRSFKAINSNDLILEENNGAHQNRPITAVIDELFSNSKTSKQFNDKHTSASVHDLIEKFSSIKLRNKSSENFSGVSNVYENQTVVIRNDLKPKDQTDNSKRNSTSKLGNNKLYIERPQSYTINSLDKRPCSGEFKLENSTNSPMDSSFRVYKMTSEAKNSYELPKLLIREDSPVETFHSSDPQLETIALRGDSPKTVVESFQKLEGGDTTMKPSTDTDCKGPSESILKSPWSHHHSELGLNNLELNFLNDELSDCEGATCLKKSNSVLKIASNLEINKWKTAPEFDGKSPHSATSLNFINGDISSSDEDDAFNSCELLHGNSKSKSVELNEFRMMFGSSPTLLNYNPVTQTSRLDAVPFQYRRGYSNLNDACLSSSTSDLECFHSGKKSNKSGGGGGAGQELSSLLRHRNNGHLDYVRSFENLDRAKIVRMKNEKRSSSNSGSGGSLCGGNSTSANSRNDWKFHNHFERDRVQEEDSSDDYSYSNLGYDNAVGRIGFPVGYQSNESLLNLNFDTLEDEVFEIDALGLFDQSDLPSNNARLLLDEKPKSNSTFMLPEITNIPPQINDKILPVVQKSIKSPLPPKRPQKLRCAQCNKKLGVIMVMKCHCEKLFCAQHRYAEAHNCSYNFKLEGKQILTRENPLVIAQKLPKI